MPWARPCAKKTPAFKPLLIVIFFSLFCASADFGKTTVSTPFLRLAPILSVSTPAGTWNRASEGAEAPSQRVVLLLFLFLFGRFALDGQYTIGEPHINILLTQPGELGRDLVLLLFRLNRVASAMSLTPTCVWRTIVGSPSLAGWSVVIVSGAPRRRGRLSRG
jgi:hypothetical protein